MRALVCEWQRPGLGGLAPRSLLRFARRRSTRPKAEDVRVSLILRPLRCGRRPRVDRYCAATAVFAATVVRLARNVGQAASVSARPLLPPHRAGTATSTSRSWVRWASSSAWRSPPPVEARIDSKNGRTARPVSFFGSSATTKAGHPSGEGRKYLGPHSVRGKDRVLLHST
jgi:hypothetical protein